MKDKQARILYIGKAKNLRARLKQYFNKSGDERQMVPYLIEQVHTIETIITLSEKDALLLEAQLIKKHQPKYNILLKDDKSFVSLMITHHQWPMIQLLRFKKRPSSKEGILFGPYTNASIARKLFDMLCQIFPLRQCSNHELANRVRPCLLFDMKRCLAPCVNRCTQAEYQHQVALAIDFLKGHKNQLIDKLQKERALASERLEFEKAQEFHLMIQQVENVQTQLITRPANSDCDVVALYRKDSLTIIVTLSIREGSILASEHFSFHFLASEEAQILESFLLQHYEHSTVRPQQILISIPLDHQQILEEILSIKITYPQRGKNAQLIEMGKRNAKALWNKEQNASSLKEKMLLDLVDTLKLTRFPQKIECLDTSNIAGSAPVASIVCFTNGEKDNKRSRLFHIKGKGDDYTAMKEVLERHLSKQKQSNDFPDLLIVDGGKGQLSIAQEIFNSLDIANIDLIALAKQDARHDKGLTQEQIFIPYQPDPLCIDRKSPLLFLLQKIRDEAHRTAITFHRKKRKNTLLKSEIDSIPGIGSIKKRRLLQHFGSPEAVKRASHEDLMQVSGLSKKDIVSIKKWQSGS